jgi:hypothetical protein
MQEVLNGLFYTLEVTLLDGYSDQSGSKNLGAGLDAVGSVRIYESAALINFFYSPPLSIAHFLLSNLRRHR